MAYESRIEDMLNGIKSYVESGIGTYLAGITAAKGDGIPLDDFETVAVGERDPFGISLLPACLVTPERWGIKALSLGEDTIGIVVAFQIVFAGDNEETMLTQALRYAEALRQLLTADETCGGACDAIADETETTNVPAAGDGTRKKVIVFEATFQKDVAR